ncbi:hypothetical protein ACFL27_25085, partial [candidate division CSSED10-310 bacterium]
KPMLVGVGRPCDALLVVSHCPTGTSRGGDDFVINPSRQFSGTLNNSKTNGSHTIRGIANLKLFLRVDYGKGRLCHVKIVEVPCPLWSDFGFWICGRVCLAVP